jgi:hypothetical protein
MIGASDAVRARSVLTGRATMNFARKLATAVRVTSETAGGDTAAERLSLLMSGEDSSRVTGLGRHR